MSWRNETSGTASSSLDERRPRSELQDRHPVEYAQEMRDIFGEQEH